LELNQKVLIVVFDVFILSIFNTSTEGGEKNEEIINFPDSVGGIHLSGFRPRGGLCWV